MLTSKGLGEKATSPQLSVTRYQIPYSEPSFEFTLIQESKPTHRPQPPSSNPIDES